jgi:hypothetical protein
MNSIQREWREGKVRPIPGNSPHDRPVSRVISSSPRRVCDDPFPATPHPPQATPARPFCVFQAWRNLSVRWSSKPKSKTKTCQTRAGVPPPVGRPPMPGKGRDGRNYAPCSSSAMSSGRLFLDRVARQCWAMNQRHKKAVIYGQNGEGTGRHNRMPGPAAVGRQCSGAHFEPVRPVWPRVA